MLKASKASYNIICCYTEYVYDKKLVLVPGLEEANTYYLIPDTRFWLLINDMSHGNSVR